MDMHILGKPTDQDPAQHCPTLLPVPMSGSGIPLYWIVHIQAPMVILPGHLILWKEIKMTQD